MKSATKSGQVISGSFAPPLAPIRLHVWDTLASHYPRSAGSGRAEPAFESSSSRTSSRTAALSSSDSLGEASDIFSMKGSVAREFAPNCTGFCSAIPLT